MFLENSWFCRFGQKFAGEYPVCLLRGSPKITNFQNLLFSHFGIGLREKERRWFAVDGKELRGSIEAGARRGEAMVQAVEHASGRTRAQTYYCGKKESEVGAVRELIEKGGLMSQKMSFDALHCKPETLFVIVESKGKYLVGLKANQKELRRQALKTSEAQAILWKQSKIEKGHGRIERRSYEFYDILEMAKAHRWRKCQMRRLVKVRRTGEELKSGKKSRETSYYVTNETGNYEELAEAIRSHWQVETSNYVRDVTFREDALRSKKRI